MQSSDIMIVSSGDRHVMVISPEINKRFIRDKSTRHKSPINQPPFQPRDRLTDSLWVKLTERTKERMLKEKCEWKRSLRCPLPPPPLLS